MAQTEDSHRLERLIGEIDGVPNRGTPASTQEAQKLKQDAENLLLLMGSDFDAIRSKVEASTKEVIRPDRPGGMPRLHVDPDLPGIRNYLDIARQKATAPKEIQRTQAVTTSAPQGHTLSATTRGRSKRLRHALRQKKHLKPSQVRARRVAKVIKELDRLRPRMLSDPDYDALRKEYPHFLTFSICRRNPQAKEWVVNVQSRRRNIGLAHELVAIDSGVKSETVKLDWKLHKPQKYRQARNN